MNKSLVTLVQELGCKGGRHQRKRRRPVKSGEKIFERTGYRLRRRNNTEVNPKILYDLLEKDFLPIVCPIGLDEELSDTTISMRMMQPVRLRERSTQKNWHSLTDIEGVYKDPEDPSTLISELPVSDAKKLIDRRIYGRRHAPEIAELH